MKTKICSLFLLTALLFFVSCEASDVVKGDSIFGHWEWCDPVDAMYQPVTPDHSETLYLEKDLTWKFFRNGVLESEGTFVAGVVEHYLDEDSFDLGEQHYLDFTGKDGSVKREYYMYFAEEDKIAYIYRPGSVGLPAKIWKRVK